MYFLYDLALHLDSYLFQVLALTAIIGAVLAATTREDAFRAGDRQGKWAVSYTHLTLPTIYSV